MYPETFVQGVFKTRTSAFKRYQTLPQLVGFGSEQISIKSSAVMNKCRQMFCEGECESCPSPKGQCASIQQPVAKITTNQASRRPIVTWVNWARFANASIYLTVAEVSLALLALVTCMVLVGKLAMTCFASLEKVSQKWEGCSKLQLLPDQWSVFCHRTDAERATDLLSRSN